MVDNIAEVMKKVWENRTSNYRDNWGVSILGRADADAH